MLSDADLAWAEGYRAQQSHDSTIFNHYLVGTEAYLRWEEGFNDASSDEEKFD